MKKVFLIVLVIACMMRLQPVALAQEVNKLPRSTPNWKVFHQQELLILSMLRIQAASKIIAL